MTTIARHRTEGGRQDTVKPAVHIGELASGDILRIHDWHLHVLTVTGDIVSEVLTAEFHSLLHFAKDDVVDVVRSIHQPPARPAERKSGKGSNMSGLRTATAVELQDADPSAEPDARWVWTIDSSAIRQAQQCVDPALQDVLLGWQGLPEDLACRRPR